MSEHPELLDVVSRVIGAPPALFQDMALLKPPRIGREKPWHQDHAYFDLPLDTPVVGVWIALDRATTDNGCMTIIPGSHRRGPVVHFQRRDWQICDTHVDNRGALAVPLEPGGCLLFSSFMHHGTPHQHRRRAPPRPAVPLRPRRRPRHQQGTAHGRVRRRGQVRHLLTQRGDVASQLVLLGLAQRPFATACSTAMAS